MTFIVETGYGTPGANSYASVDFATTYLAALGRVTENGWQTTSNAVKQQRLVDGTFYIDRRFGDRFRGTVLTTRVPGRAASGTLTFTGVPSDGETVTVGTTTYRFRNSLVAENDVLIGTVSQSLARLATAITEGGDGLVVEGSTRENRIVDAKVAGSVLTITAAAYGVNGNTISLSTTVTGATVSAATLTGGIDEGPQPLAFPRRGLVTSDGSEIVGVPYQIRAAATEYAIRGLNLPLQPDPIRDDRGGVVTSKTEQVGPIRESTNYLDGARLPFVPYPAADEMLRPFLRASGRVIRG
jgi:hypothetical protein